VLVPVRPGWPARPAPSPAPVLRCGPLLRHTSTSEAVLWVELAESMDIEVRYWSLSRLRPGVPMTARAAPAKVGDSFYAWIACRFLLPNTWYQYEIYGRGLTGGWRRLWPDPRLTVITRPSVFRALPSFSLDRFRVAFGSCRLGDAASEARGVDALRVLAESLAAGWENRDALWPHQLLLMGDQVYVDDLSDPLRTELRRIDHTATRPDRASTFRQYAAVYREGWAGTPQVRWLLSVLPSAMIFDDHEIGDDWNITKEWVAAHQSTAWRRIERDGLLAYWIYQGAGNLPPSAWRTDERMRPLVPAMRRIAGDVTAQLQRLIESYQRGTRRADWGYAFDAAGVRVVLADTRTHRKLTGRRLIMDDVAWQQLVADVKQTTRRNLLLVLPSPFLTQMHLHEMLSIAGAYLDDDNTIEPWRRGPAVEFARLLLQVLPGLAHKYVQEQAVDSPDAELWASFPESFDRMLTLLEDLHDGRGTVAKNFVALLSGDVHHSFVMRGELRRTTRLARFVNITSSPFRRPDDSADKKRDIYRGKWTYDLLRLFGTPPFVADQRRRCRWYPLSKDGQYHAVQPLDDWAFWGSFVGWIEFTGSRVRFGLDKADHSGMSPLLAAGP
jgi:hypothetical protein